MVEEYKGRVLYLPKYKAESNNKRRIRTSGYQSSFIQVVYFMLYTVSIDKDIIIMFRKYYIV